MEVRTRDPGGSVDRIYGAIAKAAAKDKFLDFRNALTLAFLEDYGNIQGTGGANHAPVSGIRLLIQDNSNGQSKNADAILPCFMIDKILEVCKANIAAPVDESRRKATEKATVFNGVSNAIEVSSRLYLAMHQFVSNFMMSCANIVKGRGNQNGPYAEFGGSFKKTIAALQTPTQTNTFPANNPYMDYSYHQDRVYADKRHRNDPSYLASVTLMDITRKQFKQDGQISTYPWTVSINKFKAPPIYHKNGTTAYDAKAQKADEVSVFIQVSDSDMWKCCYTVQHFISVWEMAYGIPLVQNGIAAHEYQVIEFRKRSTEDKAQANSYGKSEQNTVNPGAPNTGQQYKPQGQYYGSGNDRW